MLSTLMLFLLGDESMDRKLSPCCGTNKKLANNSGFILCSSSHILPRKYNRGTMGAETRSS
jgi:hypothetical protein